MNAKWNPKRSWLPAAWVVVLGAMLTCAGCRRDPAEAAGGMTRIAPGPIAATFGAAEIEGSTEGLRLAYADLRSHTLVLLDVPGAGSPPGEPLVMDRIAEGAEWAEDLGSLAYASISGVEYLAYLDRPGDGDLTLKQLYRSAADERWSVDLVTPTGRPLGFLSSEGGVWLLLQSGSGIEAAGVSPRVRGQRRQMIADVVSEGRVSVIRRDGGDTAVLHDATTGRMILVGWTGPRTWSLELRPPRGGSFGPVYHARVDGEGGLCLFYHDPVSLELLDLCDLEGYARLVRVTRARDVSAVEAATDATGTSYVWADMTLEAGGRLVPTLSILRVSGGPMGAVRRIARSAAPFRSLRLFATSRELAVLALSDDLDLYRLAR